MFRIDLSSNLSLQLEPHDPAAEKIVSSLARIMGLKRGNSSAKKAIISTQRFRRIPNIPLPTGKEAQIILSDHDDALTPDLLITQIMRLAFFIVLEAIGSRGLLLHGAMVEKEGKGAILAGPGGIGKTTACSRLPHPWKTQSDDTTLLIPAGNGGYRAHPWPTWSRFLDNGPGGSWPVEEAIPLRTLFFYPEIRRRTSPPSILKPQSVFWPALQRRLQDRCWSMYWKEEKLLRCAGMLLIRSAGYRRLFPRIGWG